MAYTPIGWQTGDTITAEKMNKMDNGWSIENTQIFSETVTTVLDEYEEYSATLEYSGIISGNPIIVTFNGTDYVCERSDISGSYSYGDMDGFSTYPFWIYSSGGVNTIGTQGGGAYSVTVSAMSVVVSSDFEKAVAVAEPSHDFEIISGTTTWAEAHTAFTNKKNTYFFLSSDQKVYVLFVGATDVYRVIGVAVDSNGTLYAAGLSASSEDGVLS